MFVSNLLGSSREVVSERALNGWVVSASSRQNQHGCRVLRLPSPENDTPNVPLGIWCIFYSYEEGNLKTWRPVIGSARFALKVPWSLTYLAFWRRWRGLGKQAKNRADGGTSRETLQSGHTICNTEALSITEHASSGWQTRICKAKECVSVTPTPHEIIRVLSGHAGRVQELAG